MSPNLLFALRLKVSSRDQGTSQISSFPPTLYSSFNLSKIVCQEVAVGVSVANNVQSVCRVCAVSVKT